MIHNNKVLESFGYIAVWVGSSFIPTGIFYIIFGIIFSDISNFHGITTRISLVMLGLFQFYIYLVNYLIVGVKMITSESKMCTRAIFVLFSCIISLIFVYTWYTVVLLLEPQSNLDYYTIMAAGIFEFAMLFFEMITLDNNTCNKNIISYYR